MTRAEFEKIKQRLPISESTARRNKVADSGNAHPGVQELQAGDLRQEVTPIPYADRPSRRKADGTNHRKFRVTIIFNYSDNRRRDLDGAAATILDCLMAARRRLMAMDTGTKL
jgi:hypothetical protein